MVLPPLAPVADLAARLGRDPDSLSVEDEARATATLDDASALVRAEGRQDWYDTETDAITAPHPVVTVVLSAAQRAFTNPEGLISETVGPFTKRRAERGDLGVFLTAAEKDIVRRYRTTSPGLWTQRTTRGEDGTSTLFMEDSFGSELFPVGSEDEGVW